MAQAGSGKSRVELIQSREPVLGTQFSAPQEGRSRSSWAIQLEGSEKGASRVVKRNLTVFADFCGVSTLTPSEWCLATNVNVETGREKNAQLWACMSQLLSTTVLRGPVGSLSSPRCSKDEAGAEGQKYTWHQAGGGRELAQGALCHNSAFAKWKWSMGTSHCVGGKLRSTKRYWLPRWLGC